MELNAEQIKKELEGLVGFTVCPEYIKNALGLIKELTEEKAKLVAENAKLKHFDLEAMRGKADSYKELCSKYIEENERLKSENDMLLDIKRLNIDKVIADTVRKMQELIKERCIKGGIYPAFVASTIDQIAKEMLEGENES